MSYEYRSVLKRGAVLAAAAVISSSALMSVAFADSDLDARMADPSNWADMMQNSRLIADAYDEQQSQLKCGWCWHCSGHESAAMWKLYADSGVAIQTTLRRIAAAISPDVCFEAARIQYGNRESGQID